MRPLLLAAILALWCAGCASDHHNPNVGERWGAAYDPTNGVADAFWGDMSNTR
jgi:hypothetical protein